MKWEIELYEKANGECPVLDYIQSLPPKHRAKIEKEIDLLEKHGINLIFPHTRKVEGDRYKGLWELRIKFNSDTYRVFYFLYLQNTFVLLHAFLKKKNRTPRKELEIALQRMKDYKEKKGEETA